MSTPITLRRLFRNYVSLGGGIVAGTSFVVNIFLLFLDFLSPTQNPYVGIVTYMILPGFTMTGLGIVLAGAALRFRQLRRGAQVVELPRLDLNNTRHRLALFGGILAIVVFLGLSAVGGYESYHYTDSVAFCGKTCHAVMEPEYSAYQNSAHARVPCVSCHIGPGAEWYVRSKINGAYQVYSVLFEKYSRPIPTPIRHLRPSQDICEQCHWPAKFWGEQLASRVHFSSDERNTRREVDLLIKTGGGGQHGLSQGIHWHMNIANKVYYVAADDRRQVIPWVKTEASNGDAVEYASTEKPLSPEQLKQADVRRMDCMDCHNRPSHRYLPPGRALDPSFQAGKISTDLPYIKKIAIEAMVQPFQTKAAAEQGIERHIRDFYAKAYPNILKDSEARVREAIAEVKRVYGQNFFPYMRVNWQAYPENIGHKEFPGCFRCHDGKHVSKDGRVIRKDCATCHDFLERRGGSFARTEATAAFAHPWKLAGRHADVLCGTCHTGGVMKPATCRGCHGIPDSGAPMAAMACKDCHLKEQQVQPLARCATCHPAVAGLHTKEPHKEAGCVACHSPHAWAVQGRDGCLTCHGDKAQHNPGPACAECHDFKPAAAAGKQAAPSAPPPIVFPADPSSPGAVTFEHARHLAKGAKCGDCHPGLFAMKKGRDTLSMEGMGEGKQCGACHDGTKAFGVMDGEACTTCHKTS